MFGFQIWELNVCLAPATAVAAIAVARRNGRKTVGMCGGRVWQFRYVARVACVGCDSKRALKS